MSIGEIFALVYLISFCIVIWVVNIRRAITFFKQPHNTPVNGVMKNEIYNTRSQYTAAYNKTNVVFSNKINEFDDSINSTADNKNKNSHPSSPCHIVIGFAHLARIITRVLPNANKTYLVIELLTGELEGRLVLNRRPCCGTAGMIQFYWGFRSCHPMLSSSKVPASII